MDDCVRAEENAPTCCALCEGSENLMLCAGCKDTWYCTKDHQRQHWKQHKIACKAKSALTGYSKPKNDNQLVTGGNATGAVSNSHMVEGASTQGLSELKDLFDDLFNTEMPFPTYNSSYPHMADATITNENSQQATLPNVNSNKKEVKIADYVLKCLTDYGICVVDNFMSFEKCSSIFGEVNFLDKSGVMQAGELVSKLDTNRKVRGDKITWIENGDPTCPHISSLIQRLDSIVLTYNGKLDRYTINGRTKAMVACYPGNGTYYMRHVDNPNEDGRCVTCIYYLNKDWDISKDGGLLRIFPAKFNQVADIEPKFDRLLFFWSDRRNPHEVQPAYRTRYAITVWYFDAEERLRAKLKHQTRGEDSALTGL